jgi:hypothetical protein
VISNAFVAAVYDRRKYFANAGAAADRGQKSEVSSRQVGTVHRTALLQNGFPSSLVIGHSSFASYRLRTKAIHCPGYCPSPIPVT